MLWEAWLFATQLGMAVQTWYSGFMIGCLLHTFASGICAMMLAIELLRRYTGKSTLAMKVGEVEKKQQILEHSFLGMRYRFDDLKEQIEKDVRFLEEEKIEPMMEKVEQFIQNAELKMKGEPTMEEIEQLIDKQ